jgi:hypothetical protein
MRNGCDIIAMGPNGIRQFVLSVDCHFEETFWAVKCGDTVFYSATLDDGVKE